MKQYTIYCTDEQVKKALNLGAPLNGVYKQVGDRPIYYTLPTSDPKWMDCDAYYMPTAEEMIGWLETRNIFIHINPVYDISCDYYISAKGYEFYSYTSKPCVVKTRKEATLAAIDAALDYLNKIKK